MVKVPYPGTVKTRLQPFLTPEKCAELAAAFLRDAENKAKTVCNNTILAYSPVEQRNALLVNISQSKNILVEQTGANLGERMFNAFEFAFAQDSDAVVMIGTDSPTFPADFIGQAFNFLKTDSDIVLGKTEDGGFYLIGLRKNHIGLLDNIAWSSASVFEQTTRNVKRLGLRLKQIPKWYDVDTAADLFRLREEILAAENLRFHAPNTFQWLAAHSRLFDTL